MFPCRRQVHIFWDAVSAPPVASSAGEGRRGGCPPTLLEVLSSALPTPVRNVPLAEPCRCYVTQEVSPAITSAFSSSDVQMITCPLASLSWRMCNDVYRCVLQAQTRFVSELTIVIVAGTSVDIPYMIETVRPWCADCCWIDQSFTVRRYHQAPTNAPRAGLGATTHGDPEQALPPPYALVAPPSWSLRSSNRSGAVNWMGAGEGKILFHFNPRPKEEQIVMNTMVGGVWGTEERIPLPPGPELVGEVTAETTGFVVELRGRSEPYLYKHRVPLDQLTTVVASDTSTWTVAKRGANGAADAPRSADKATCQLEDGAVYEIHAAHQPSLRVDVQRAGSANGTKLWLYPRNETAAQQFIARCRRGGGGRACDSVWAFEPLCAPGFVVDSGGSANRHCHLWAASDDNRNQGWLLSPCGDRSFTVRAEGNRQQVWDISGAGGAHADLLNWGHHGGANQRFFFTRVADAPRSADKAADGGWTVVDGVVHGVVLHPTK